MNARVMYTARYLDKTTGDQYVSMRPTPLPRAGYDKPVFVLNAELFRRVYRYAFELPQTREPYIYEDGEQCKKALATLDAAEGEGDE